MLATGVNIDKNHPLNIEEELIKMHASVHAEIRVLKKIGDATGVTIYVARVKRDGNPGLSAPCDTCVYLCEQAGVSRIVHS